MNTEGEFVRDWSEAWAWQRPAAAPHEIEPQDRVEPDFVGAVVSEVPPEIDLASLPRWMRAVPEQWPPFELEFEAGRGPATEWD